MSRCNKEVNISDPERIVSVLGGGAMVYGGLRRGGLRGTVMIVTGAGLLFRGVTGYCGLYAAQGKKCA